MSDDTVVLKNANFDVEVQRVRLTPAELIIDASKAPKVSATGLSALAESAMKSASAQKGTEMDLKKIAGGAAVVIVLGWLILGFAYHYRLLDTPPPFWKSREQALVEVNVRSVQDSTPPFRGLTTVFNEPTLARSNPRVINPGGRRLPEAERNAICELTGEGNEIDITPYVGPGYQSINCWLNNP